MADYDDGCRLKSISTKCPTKNPGHRPKFNASRKGIVFKRVTRDGQLKQSDPEYEWTEQKFKKKSIS
jgi:hypothetical protein